MDDILDRLRAAAEGTTPGPWRLLAIGSGGFRIENAEGREIAVFSEGGSIDDALLSLTAHSVIPEAARTIETLCGKVTFLSRTVADAYSAGFLISTQDFNGETPFACDPGQVARDDRYRSAFFSWLKDAPDVAENLSPPSSVNAALWSALLDARVYVENAALGDHRNPDEAARILAQIDAALKACGVTS
jgi:hypothetical protein